jgi:hypothetical protein
MVSLEQERSIFDHGETGLILIGMPGLDERMTSRLQSCSRIGLVHEFQPRCCPDSPSAGIALDAIGGGPPPPAIRSGNGGEFQLLAHLLTQMERIIEVNALQKVTKAVVAAAREGPVIGKA